MAQSFDKRFAGREIGVVAEIRLDGWWKFINGHGIQGTYALDKWFKKQPGCENDSIYRYISSDNPLQDLPLVKQIMLAIQAERSRHEAFVAECQANLEEANRRMKYLEEQLRYYRLGEYKNLKPILELLQNKGDPVIA